jgi:hypothetical protein
MTQRISAYYVILSVLYYLHMIQHCKFIKYLSILDDTICIVIGMDNMVKMQNL